MKSVVVHPDTSILGGGEIVCALVIRALSNLGYETQLATETLGGGVVKDLVHDSTGRTLDLLSMRQRSLPFLATYLRLLSARVNLASLRSTEADLIISTQALLPMPHLREGQRHVLYVHYPAMRTLEATQDSLLRNAYLTPARMYLEGHLRGVDIMLCNSLFTKQAILRYWGEFSPPDPHVVYPSSLRHFDPSAGFQNRGRRCVYVGRLTPFKRHEVMKELAASLRDTDFVSAGSATLSHDSYVRRLLRNRPQNYSVVSNATVEQIRLLFEQSRLYIHCAREEHFGIALVEAMKGGCVPLVHASGGPAEIVPTELRWNSYEDLTQKCLSFLSDEGHWNLWHKRIIELSRSYSPERFEEEFSKAVF